MCVGHVVLAVTWQRRQGGAVRGLLIMEGGAMCVCMSAAGTRRQAVCVRTKNRKMI